MTAEKRKRRSFPEEFKREAVALVTEQGYKVAEAARSLVIHENVLRYWKKQYEQEENGEVLDLDEREELKRLRRENRELRMEKEMVIHDSAYNVAHKEIS